MKKFRIKTAARSFVRSLLKAFFAFSLLFPLFFFTNSQAVADEDTLGDAIKNSDIIFDWRLRYENVSASNFVNDADGLTFRARFGFQTAKFKNFVLLAEGDFTRALGVDDFNSTVNGKTTFPVIADPNSLRLNRLSLAFTGIEKTTIAVGRQRIILDDARFVGNVGFRQNEQTYDAARITTEILKGVTVDYIYLWKVNRIFGSQSSVGQTGANSHLIHLSTDKLPIGTLTAYAYLIDLDKLAALSSQTYGFRLTGKQPIGGDVSVLYTAGYARQSEYGNAPSVFGLDFFEFEGGLAKGGLVAKAGWQKLGGNGARGFQTPLATGHAFQGFADVFLNTPGSGIKDLYFIAGYTAKDVPTFKTASFMIWYHDFTPGLAGPDLGHEVDFRVAVTPEIAKKKVTFEFKFADFRGSPILPNVRKFWVSIASAF